MSDKLTLLRQLYDRRNIIMKIIAVFLSIGLFMMGWCGMMSFILEEALQAQCFGYAVAMMNKEWEIAKGVIHEEEPFIQANILLLRNQWNPITGRAFRAYANATQRKLARDKSFIDYMIQKQRKARYLAKLGR